MPQAAAFSVVLLISDGVRDAAAALDRRGNERGLSTAEIQQLEALEAQHAETRAARPRTFALIVVGSAAPLRDAFRRAREATQLGIPIVDLLGMRGAVPSGWRDRLPLTMEAWLWLGVTRLVDDLSLICTVGVSTPERQEQLEASRGLQAALGSAVELTLRQAQVPERKVDRATARVNAAFAGACQVIATDGEVAAIRAEAAAIRARRQ